MEHDQMIAEKLAAMRGPDPAERAGPSFALLRKGPIMPVEGEKAVLCDVCDEDYIKEAAHAVVPGYKGWGR